MRSSNSFPSVGIGCIRDTAVSDFESAAQLSREPKKKGDPGGRVALEGCLRAWGTKWVMQAS